MTWGAIYRTGERVPERGHKPGFYVVVSRDFVEESVDEAAFLWRRGEYELTSLTRCGRVPRGSAS